MRCPASAVPELNSAFSALAQAKYLDENSAERHILSAVLLSGEQSLRADAMGHLLSQKLRIVRQTLGGLDSLLAQYPLSTHAGRALLNLAEGALRIPDHYQLDLFIEEQLHAANWHEHRGHSASWLINWATLGLDLAEHMKTPATTPIIREAIKQALKLLAGQFIIAEHIDAALAKQDIEFRYSFDILGEAALNGAEAQQYAARYLEAIHQVGKYSQGAGQFGPSVSIKLSALHEKFDFLHYDQVQRELYPRLLELALLAKQYDIGLTIDAEESARQLLTLSLFERLMAEPDLLSWSGLGIAVQAYQKNALTVVKWLSAYTRQHHRAINVRLVKGAYWDSEIKTAQQAALANYPVWTSKELTDQSYLACAQILLQAKNRIFAQFATHNAFTVAAIHQMAGSQNYEFQALFGMGETLYQLAHELGIDRPCRLYAPVGAHAQLLPYLVRRFLENGANTSFVHQVQTQTASVKTQAKIMPPTKCFGPREVPTLLDLQHWPHFQRLEKENCEAQNQMYTSLSSTQIEPNGNTQQIRNPANQRDIVGEYCESQLPDIELAFRNAELQQLAWASCAVLTRANLIEAVAQELEAHRPILIHLLIREAGKTMGNAQNELREAIDFCRYYAAQARSNWQHETPQPLGIIVAISPWNFPLAIYVGQICCALLAGNVVIAKPAPETPLIAAQALACFYRAGIPQHALQMLPGGAAIGAALTYDHRCHGVCFTGSLASARKIRLALAEFGADRVLVAETGGINAMIIDSSAQADQAIHDILNSAFDSAGQRCSALRLLCLQDDIASDFISRLKRCMQDLIIGEPEKSETEIGPVINAKAERTIKQALHAFQRLGYPIYQAQLPDTCSKGHYVPPTLIELPTLAALSDEIFGPVLCVYRYRAKQLTELLNDINSLGFGLTMGIHSRINQHIAQITQQTQIGNYYINRNQIGAVVGSQPFGGQNKSGTGPKAGGPWALFRLVKNSDPCVPHYQKLPTLLEKLRQLAHLWPDLDQGVDLEILLEDAARRSSIDQSIQLPSICGEQNEMRYRGRGQVACLGPSEWDIIQQVGIAILTGNQAVIADRRLFEQWKKYLGPTHLTIAQEPLHGEIHAAMCHPILAVGIEKQLARREGAIVPLIQPFEDGKWPLYRLMVEYTISTNTAATGGDIALLTRT